MHRPCGRNYWLWGKQSATLIAVFTNPGPLGTSVSPPAPDLAIWAIRSPFRRYACWSW